MLSIYLQTTVLKEENSDWRGILQTDLLIIGILMTRPLKFCSEVLKQLRRHTHAFSLVLYHVVQSITWY